MKEGNWDLKPSLIFMPDLSIRKASVREQLGENEPLFDIHPAVAPREGDVLVTKQRIGPFSTTDLDEKLQSLRIEILVLQWRKSYGYRA